MAHYNNSYISVPIIRDVFHKIGQFVLGMPDLVLQAIGRDLVPFHGVDLMALHLEARQRATVHLEFNITI